MWTFFGQRLVGMAMVMVTMSVVVFLLQSVIAADPARAIAGPTVPLERIEELRKELGLDDPVIVQYGRFLSRLSDGDLGTSVRTRQPISEDIARYLPASIELAIVALMTGLAMASFFAIAPLIFKAAISFRLLLTVFASIPIFMSSLLMLYVFWFWLGWFPGGGRGNDSSAIQVPRHGAMEIILSGDIGAFLDALAHLALPSITLALPIAISVGRVLSSAMREVMQEEYIRTARGKGLSEARVVIGHALRNALPSTLAMTGLQIRLLFGNLLVVELVFSWPGLGLYMVQSLGSSDLPAVLGVTMVLGAFYIGLGLLIEIMQTMFDPRISY